MPGTTPAPAPVPPHESIGAHVREFFEKDVEPRVASVEGDVGKLKELPAALAAYAGSIQAIVKAIAPSASPEVAVLIADAEKAAAVIAEIAAGLAASGM
jgi:hypothetical protein